MRSVALAILAALTAGSALAQQRGTELGLGVTAAGVTFTHAGKAFVFSANQQFVSVGLYASPSIAIEPAAAVSVISGPEDASVIHFGLSFPIYMRRNWGHSGLFFAPGGGVTILSSGGAGHTTQYSAGMGVGTKLRIADPVSLSVSGNLAYGFATAEFGAVTLSAQLGLSVFFQ